jgi:hypothetical protein
MPLLTAAIPLSGEEQQKLISWQDPPAWDSHGGDVEPPGPGTFLIKVGGCPGRNPAGSNSCPGRRCGMTAPNRKGTGPGDGLGIWLAIGAAVVLGGGSWVSTHLGS